MIAKIVVDVGLGVKDSVSKDIPTLNSSNICMQEDIYGN